MIHIHNGDVALSLAKRSLIPGEHIAYRESLITGPVVPGEDWIETRARALSDGTNAELLRVRTSLLEQEQALDAAAAQGEIVLWFEHDLYCLVHLVYLLQRFRDARVSVVWCPTPIGNNDEHDLELLFESRAAATPAMIELAKKVWRDYSAPDPTAINTWIERDWSDFAFLREGLTLHATRFPSSKNGLGAVEQRALELIAAGTTGFASIFDRINSEVPRLGFGDSVIYDHLRAMAARAVPLITAAGEPPKAIFGITPAGENVLSGEIDDSAINDPDFWLGGAHLTKENLWRWDERERKILPSHSRVS